jgi:polar amino acid transport system substrate-binding protein
VTTRMTENRRLKPMAVAIGVGALVLVSVLVIILGTRFSTPSVIPPVAVNSADWEPFSGPDLPGGGPIVEIMTDVLETAGFEPNVSFTTWNSAEERVATGSVFGAFPMVSSESRKDRMLFSSSLMEFEYVLFVRAGDPHVPNSSSELRNLRVGGIDGYDYWPEFEDAVTEVDRYATTVAALAALVAGEIDVLAEAEIVGMTALRTPELSIDLNEVEILDEDAGWARFKEHLYFVMPPFQESRPVLERINRAIATVKKTPAYAERIASMLSEEQDRISLVRPEIGLVPMYDAEGTVIGESPTGVTGRILQWPERAAEGEFAKVKLANGPFAGRIGWVEIRFVEVLD